MPTPPDSLNWLADELAELEQHHLRRRLMAREGAQAATVAIDHQSLVNFSANDYLGLASHPAVVAAATEAGQQAGWGAGASPLVTGRSALHAKLERRIAAFEDVEAALLFPSGFAANAGVIPALVDEGDAIFGDAKNHASIIDGCRLSRAERFIYPHGDAAALAKLLETTGPFRRRLIVTDSLFSMDGDVAPLDQLAELAEQHDAMLMVDEAHATGVWGARGGGLVEHFAASNPIVEQQVAIRVGTLSKAIGSVGGFVAGSQRLIDWLANRARSYVYSTATPAATAAAALAAFDLIEAEPHRRQQLLAQANYLRQQLQAAGWNTGESTSQIVPVMIGDPQRTMQLATHLRKQGFLVPGIRPPSVPAGESLLRISLCYGHEEAMIDRLVKSLSSTGFR